MFDLQKNVNRSALSYPDDVQLSTKKVRQELAKALIENGPQSLHEANKSRKELPANGRMSLYLCDAPGDTMAQYCQRLLRKDKQSLSAEDIIGQLVFASLYSPMATPNGIQIWEASGHEVDCLLNQIVI